MEVGRSGEMSQSDGIAWTATPCYRIVNGNVIDEIDYVYHSGIVGLWEVAIMQRFHGVPRNGLSIGRNGQVMFTASVPRTVDVYQVKCRSADFIRAHDALREMTR